MLSRNMKAFLKTTESVGKKLFFYSIGLSVFLPFYRSVYSDIWEAFIPLAIAGQAASIAARLKLDEKTNEM